MAKDYGTEAVGFACEELTFVNRANNNNYRRPSWGAIVVALVVGIASLSCIVTLHRSLYFIKKRLSRCTSNCEKHLLFKEYDFWKGLIIANRDICRDAMHSVIVVDEATTVNSNQKAFKKSEDFPTKFAVDHVTPLKTQDERGTCWDFATVGVLENSYRQQGIANGWLEEDEYMAISEQAYGAEVLRLCAGPPGSPQQVACLIPGNGIWKNTTEGGEVALLMYLVNGLKDNMYPHSICPYYPDDGNDTVCAGLTAEKRKRNPLSLALKGMETLMDERVIKRALMKDRQAMSLTTATPYTTHYYPCIGELSKQDRCNPSSESCTLCPPKLAMTTCCVSIDYREGYNMNGEFITSDVMNSEGGHVMTLVGYNDLFRTKQGYTGGFILKNSWFDGIHPALGPKHARGSLTVSNTGCKRLQIGRRLACVLIAIIPKTGTNVATRLK